MKLPRDLSGANLAKLLAVRGNRMTRQIGSHLHLTTGLPSQHHITVPLHDPLKVVRSRESWAMWLFTHKSAAMIWCVSCLAEVNLQALRRLWAPGTKHESRAGTPGIAE